MCSIVAILKKIWQHVLLDANGHLLLKDRISPDYFSSHCSLNVLLKEHPIGVHKTLCIDQFESVFITWRKHIGFHVVC